MATNGAANGVKPIVICIFCGASNGKGDKYLAAARSLAEALHRNNVTKLVYGGGSTGLMGEVAKTFAALAGPHSVHGIIPRPLLQYERETASATEQPEQSNSVGKLLPDEKIFGRTTVVKDMHERKLMMAKEVRAGGPGSGFVGLPGGFGTLEEVAEMTTWNQLGIQESPVVLYNTNGFWTKFLEFLQHATEEKFISEANAQILQSADDAEGVMTALREYKLSPGRLDFTWEDT